MSANVKNLHSKCERDDNSSMKKIIASVVLIGAVCVFWGSHQPSNQSVAYDESFPPMAPKLIAYDEGIPLSQKKI